MAVALDASLRWLAQFDHSLIKPGLDRIGRLLDVLGHPERQLSVIHLAGTNGKGSTAAMIASILQSAGYRVGLYTSPHLHHLCERMRINGEPISQERLARLVDELIGVLKVMGIETMREGQGRPPASPEQPTYFECTTAMALSCFAREPVDWAVIETGLGGRFDATNLVSPRVTVLTPIDYDHMDYLGNSLASIAWEKSGILKPGIPGVVGPQCAEVEAVIEEEARSVGAPLIRYGRDYWCEEEGEQRLTYRDRFHRRPHLSCALLGRHQLVNAATAVAAIDQLRQAGLSVEDEAVSSGLMSVRWEGRLELVNERPRLLLDGAHNPAAARALADYLRAEKQRIGGSVTLVIGVLRDKAAAEIVSTLCPVVDAWIATAPESPRALPADQLAAIIQAAGGSVIVEPDPARATQMAMARLTDRDLCCVTGSFYTIAAARHWLLTATTTRPFITPHEAVARPA